MSNFALLDAYSVLRRELSLIFAGELKDSSLGPQQVVILFRLLESPCTMSQLAAYTQADPAATSRTVSGLEKAGLVKRTADPSDARKSVIQLTSKGRAQGDTVLEIRKKIAAELNETLSSEEREQMQKLLSKVTSRLQEKRKK